MGMSLECCRWGGVCQGQSGTEKQTHQSAGLHEEMMLSKVFQIIMLTVGNCVQNSYRLWSQMFWTNEEMNKENVNHMLRYTQDSIWKPIGIIIVVICDLY